MRKLNTNFITIKTFLILAIFSQAKYFCGSWQTTKIHTQNFYRWQIFVHSIFVVSLSHEHISTTKISQIMVYTFHHKQTHFHSYTKHLVLETFSFQFFSFPVNFKNHIRLPWQLSATQESDVLHFRTLLKMGDKQDCHLQTNN